MIGCVVVLDGCVVAVYDPGACTTVGNPCSRGKISRLAG